MIDAEEAAALPPVTVEHEPVGTEIEERRADTPPPPSAEAAMTRPGADTSAAEEALQRATVATRTNGASRVVEETAKGNGRADTKEVARARKELEKADKSAAKQAAREMAALEKKEARERKALAKAAARRR
jgi:hypothetical protein